MRPHKRPRRSKVSIRSPHKSKGRRESPRGCTYDPRFQSAPLTKARGDAKLRAYCRFGKGFNPLPSQKQGETEVLFWVGVKVKCFNPLPSQKQGETHSPISIRRPKMVSIRSPHKSKGRPIPTSKFLLDSKFQSAPLTKARGDRRYTADASIVYRFQSAPLTKARGDPYDRSLRGNPWCFNPLPSQKQGETVGVVPSPYFDRVSIRSPHKSKGRRRAIDPTA